MLHVRAEHRAGGGGGRRRRARGVEERRVAGVEEVKRATGERRAGGKHHNRAAHVTLCRHRGGVHVGGEGAAGSVNVQLLERRGARLAPAQPARSKRGHRRTQLVCVVKSEVRRRQRQAVAHGRVHDRVPAQPEGGVRPRRPQPRQLRVAPRRRRVERRGGRDAQERQRHVAEAPRAPAARGAVERVGHAAQSARKCNWAGGERGGNLTASCNSAHCQSLNCRECETAVAHGSSESSPVRVEPKKIHNFNNDN